MRWSCCATSAAGNYFGGHASQVCLLSASLSLIFPCVLFFGVYGYLSLYKEGKKQFDDITDKMLASLATELYCELRAVAMTSLIDCFAQQGTAPPEGQQSLHLIFFSSQRHSYLIYLYAEFLGTSSARSIASSASALPEWPQDELLRYVVFLSSIFILYLPSIFNPIVFTLVYLCVSRFSIVLPDQGKFGLYKQTGRIDDMVTKAAKAIDDLFQKRVAKYKGEAAGVMVCSLPTSW